MSLKILGKITIQDTKCVKCDYVFRFIQKADELFCSKCGAAYILLNTEVLSGGVEMEYEFKEFRCVNNSLNICKNVCPAPDMYCKEHSSDKAVAQTRQDLTYVEERLVSLKEKLNRIQESKKTWIIEELSGINEENKEQN